MAQELIKPNRAIAPDFVGVITTFLRTTLGESVYNLFRISESAKNINFDSGSVQFYSLIDKKDVTPLWDCLQKKGLEIENLTPGDSKDMVTRFKISLNLPKEFLLEYGNATVKNFCEESASEDDDQNQAGLSAGESNQQDQQQGSAGEHPAPPEETPEIEEEEETPESDQGTDDNDDETIKTVEELIETVSMLEPKQKVRTTITFFKWYLEQNEVVDYEVLPRTAYKHQGNDPEFVVRISREEDVSKVFELFQSQGCDVDLVGGKKDGVRVKSLVIVDSVQTGKTKYKNAVKPNPKKAASISKRGKTKANKKHSSKGTKKSHAKLAKTIKTPQHIKKSALKATPKQAKNPVDSHIFTDRMLQELTLITEKLLTKKQITEGDLTKFQQIVELKRRELKILHVLEKDFNNLIKIRKLISAKCSS